MAQIKFTGGALLKLRNTRLRNPRRFNNWWERFHNPNTAPGIAWPLHAGWAQLDYTSSLITVRTIDNLSSGSGPGTWRGEWAAHNAASTFSVFIFNKSGVINIGTGGRIDFERGDFAVLGCTAPSGGIVIIGDTHSTNTNITNFYMDHVTFSPGRFDVFGGTNPDTRDAFRIGSGIQDCFIRNCAFLNGTDGNFDWSLSAGNPQKRNDLVAFLSGYMLIEAGHSEGNHDRGMNIGRGYQDLFIALGCHFTQNQRNPITQPGVQDSLSQSYENLYLANNVTYNTGQDDNPEYDLQFTNPGTPHHMAVVGHPVPIHGPSTINEFSRPDDNDGRFQPSLNAGVSPSTSESIYYCQDSYWLEERQENRSNYTFVTPNGAGGWPGQLIDFTQRWRYSGIKATGTNSTLYSESGLFPSGGVAILDSGTLPSGHPPRFTPLVMGSFYAGDHHQISGSYTIVEQWIHANTAPHPKSRPPIIARWREQLMSRSASPDGENDERISHIDDLRLGNYDPALTGSATESRSDLYGPIYGVAVAETVHSASEFYPADTSSIDSATGWPNIFIYAFRKAEEIENPLAWLDVVEHF